LALKHKLINYNSGYVDFYIPGRTNPVRIYPGEENQLVFEGLSGKEILELKSLAKIGLILRRCEPEVTEPEVTEPEVTEPEVTEPEVTEPEVTEPEVTEPEVTLEDLLDGRKLYELTAAELKDIVAILGIEVEGTLTKKRALEVLEGV